MEMIRDFFSLRWKICMLTVLLTASWGFIISILNQTVKLIIWNFSFHTDILTHTSDCGLKDIFIINTTSTDQLGNCRLT